MSYETKRLALCDITLDSDTQSRVGPNKLVLEHFYDLLLTSNVRFPPVVLFYDGKKYYLADGWHRYEAHRRALEEDISCHIYQGTKRDAILYSVGANGTHGLNMTNADKRRAVTKLLHDPEWSTWSNHKIARSCHVDPSFVSKLKKSLVTNHSEQPAQCKYVNKHGQEVMMNTEKIGRHQVGRHQLSSQQVNASTAISEPDLVTQLRAENALLQKQLNEQILLVAEKDAEISKLQELIDGSTHEEDLPF